GAVTLPLPAPPSKEFAALPEYYVEALADVLSLVARSRPELVEQRGMEEFMVFFTVFLQSKAHVKNPYLRSRMIEALHGLMPPPEGEAGFRRVGGELGALLQAHPLVVSSLVHSLVQLYVDIEMTDRHNTFYEKFTTRYQIGEVLEYLWDLPQHRAAWRAVADQHAYLYVRFINMMINDAQFLLQEAMETLPRVQEMERAQADPQAWAQRPQQERQELEEQLRQSRGRLKVRGRRGHV
ncbi:ubiquitin elongating factor, partial [Helicosporidium sp. ATCC 50920]